MDGHLRPGRLLLPLLLLLAGQLQAEVTIDAPGAEDALMTNLLARLGLEGTACDAPAWRIRRLFNRAEKDFQPALRAFGYYQAKIEKELETGGDCWQATFVIELGRARGDPQTDGQRRRRCCR